MKLRFALILLTVVLSLSTSADHTNDNCPEAWSANLNSQAFDGLGVNIHFTEPQPGEVKMIAAAGVRWVRMDFVWAETEKAPGIYDFSAYERLLGSLQPFDIGALLILDYGNPLYDHGAPPRTESARQAFARWAAAAAGHFAGRRVIWEIYNEPNNEMFWRPKPAVDEYVALALTVGKAFRSAAPNEKLMGPATGMDFPFIEACFKAGLLNYWSAVSVHPYRQTNPENAARDYCRLRRMIQQYRLREEIPIISSEWGYSAAWRNMDEEKQSALLARQMLTNAANGVPISIWYDWRNDGSDPAEPEENFGLVSNSYQSVSAQPFEPKPAYRAMKTVSEFLAGYKLEKRLVIGSDDDYVLVFAKGPERRIAAWTTSPAAHRITIPLDAGEYKLTTHIGASSIARSSNPPGLSIKVSTAPVYLVRVKAD
jgi:polysaccharide biosynthesis protein PslG